MAVSFMVAQEFRGEEEEVEEEEEEEEVEEVNRKEGGMKPMKPMRPDQKTAVLPWKHDYRVLP